MSFILRVLSTLPVLIKGPDNHGGYGHFTQEAEGQESVGQDQVWAFGLGCVFFVRGLNRATHI